MEMGDRVLYTGVLNSEAETAMAMVLKYYSGDDLCDLKVMYFDGTEEYVSQAAHAAEDVPTTYSWHVRPGGS